MAYFDRFDIMSAWNLHLQSAHRGNGSRNYGRLSKIARIYKPSASEESVSGLSENAREIYARLRLNDRGFDYHPQGRLNRPEHPIANQYDDCQSTLYRMWASDVQVYVWADSFGSAFEEFTEWLDDNAPGCLVAEDEFMELLDDAAKDLYGKDWATLESECDGDVWEMYEDVREQAEADLTMIGHTTLKHGSYIASHEWGGEEVTGSEEFDTVLLAQTEVAQEHFAYLDREAAIDEYVETYKTYELPSRYRDSYEHDHNARVIASARAKLVEKGIEL